MKKDFRRFIAENTVLFDGGMGSMLIDAGLSENEIPEVWNFIHPDRLVDIHMAYLDAGADVIQTNTFGASAIKLAASEAGRSLDPARVNESAASLAREALKRFGEDDRFIAGDIGPTGEFFPPMGRLSAEKAREAFRAQVQALENGGVDIFLIETMYDIREALEALRAVREISGKPAVVELTFDRKPKGYFTIMGNTPEMAASVLPEAGADVIGANCTLPSDQLIDLASRFRELTEVPLLFQPNAGKPELKDGKAIYAQSPEEFAVDIGKMIAAGVNAVGGCCGTTPEFISAIRRRIDSSG